MLKTWADPGINIAELSSIVQNAGNNWLFLSLSQQVDSLLNGLPMLNFHANSAIFTAVRLFIEQSARFK
jgi:hypothetical protein